MVNRITMAAESIKNDDCGKHVFNIVENFSAEEWQCAINMNDANYELLKPYLLYTYDKTKIEELIELTSIQTVSHALVEAWFCVIYGRRQEKDLQPSFKDVTRAPILIHIFEGHLLQIIEQAEYNEDISDFITSKFKMLLNEYFNVLSKKKNPADAKKALIGASTGSTQYPPITDYSSDRLENINEFVCFLMAIDMCIKCLNTDYENSNDKEMIRNGSFHELIVNNSPSVKEKYQNERNFTESYNYVSDKFEKHINQLSAYMFSNEEKDLLSFIYKEKGYIPESDKLSEKIPNDDEELILDPIRNIDFQDNVSQGDLSTKQSKKTGIISYLNKVFGTKKHTNKTTKDDDNYNNDDNNESYDSFIISAKKESNNAPIIITLLCIIVVGSIIYFRGSDVESKSIIDKSEIVTDGNPNTEYRTIVER